MKFVGIGKTFSTRNENQYNTIGEFWDALSKEYGKENLRGLGHHWTSDTIEYVIGLKTGTIDDANVFVELPDNGWSRVTGKLSNLGKMYDEIYREGRLTYEIETFCENGDCEILYYR